MSTRVLDSYLITPTIILGKKTTLNNIFAYKLTNFEYKNPTNALINLPEQLTDIQYTLLLRHKISTNWNLMMLPQLIIRSDFEGKFTNDAFFPAFVAIANHKSQKNDRLTLGYGLSYSRDFLKNTISPVLAVSYTSPHFRINAVLPNNAQLTFIPEESWEFGTAVNVETAIYSTKITSGFNAKYLRTINLPVSLTASHNIYGMRLSEKGSLLLLYRVCILNMKSFIFQDCFKSYDLLTRALYWLIYGSLEVKNAQLAHLEKLCAIATNPNSTATLGSFLKVNLLKLLFCLIFPKTGSGSIQRCGYNSFPLSLSSLVFACNLNCFKSWFTSILRFPLALWH